jgi:hypothetical protein
VHSEKRLAVRLALAVWGIFPRVARGGRERPATSAGSGARHLLVWQPVQARTRAAKAERPFLASSLVKVR